MALLHIEADESRPVFPSLPPLLEAACASVVITMGKEKMLPSPAHGEGTDLTAVHGTRWPPAGSPEILLWNGGSRLGSSRVE